MDFLPGRLRLIALHAIRFVDPAEGFAWHRHTADNSPLWRRPERQRYPLLSAPPRRKQWQNAHATSNR